MVRYGLDGKLSIGPLTLFHDYSVIKMLVWQADLDMAECSIWRKKVSRGGLREFGPTTLPQGKMSIQHMSPGGALIWYLYTFLDSKAIIF